MQVTVQPSHVRPLTRSPHHLVNGFGAVLVFVAAFSLYAATLAPGPVPGDPSEYIFVPYILGVAHPPGYAFYTLLARLWQTIVQAGTVAFRTNLLAAFAGALVVTLVYGIVQQVCHSEPRSGRDWAQTLPAVFAALSAMAGVDLWQHSLYSNAHILTTVLATLDLFLLVCWQRTANDRWLYSAVFVAGLSLTHHPILAFSFPAFAVFVLLVKPRLLVQPRKLIALAASLALGLVPFLYYPLRGPSAPFNTLPTQEAMLIHVTARGLTVNLFPFGLSDQPTRLIVFGELLRLQYPLVTITLAALGALWLMLRQPKLLALVCVFLLFHLGFVLNTLQDVLAYLMPSFVVLAVLASLGLSALMTTIKNPGHTDAQTPDLVHWVSVCLGVLMVFIPLTTVAHNMPRVSLRGYRAGDAWVEAVFDQFAGKRQHAVLLAEWEALTPLWVAQYTQGRTLDPADVKLVYVAATSTNPWLDGVFAHWNEGPVYLSNFRRGVWEGGAFRLRPEGKWPFWRVVAPGEKSAPDGLTPLNLSAENTLELLSYSIDQTRLRPGDTAHLTLAMRSPITLTQYVMPFARVGERQYRWTTDSRSTPPWRPGEIIVERYDITLPLGAPPGEYPLRLGIHDTAQGRDLNLANSSTMIQLGSLTVEPSRGIVPPQRTLDAALANFNSEIALMGGTVRAGFQSARLLWQQPLAVRRGQAIDVWLDWRALKQVNTSYKVFVHLIQNDQLAAPAADYYTPLGGAFPTHLWIPVWIEGQSVSDPNRLTLPANLPSGNYAVEIGLYDLISTRRAAILDRNGNLAGDRVILGPLSVR